MYIYVQTTLDTDVFVCVGMCVRVCLYLCASRPCEMPATTRQHARTNIYVDPNTQIHSHRHKHEDTYHS